MTNCIVAFFKNSLASRHLWLIVALFLLIANLCHAGTPENCTKCHKFTVSGVHKTLACLACHISESATVANPAAAGENSPCVRCHQGLGTIFTHTMATRANELEFAARSYNRVDKSFFKNNCNGCHLKGCLDCHEGGGHRIGKASMQHCLSCHRGYYVGWDYAGRAPREDSLRYQRGKSENGEHYLTMRPDIHYEKGLVCSDCHSMKSLASGRKSSKGCTDCHKISNKPIEHRIKAHLEKMECYACHSAWAPQEYGTFFLRFSESPSKEDFWLKGSETSREYLRSAYLRTQDMPPLGLNSRGMVSPIRPQFIAYYTHIQREKIKEKENRLLAAEWKAYFPHTIRRGTVMCDECHDAPARFVLESSQNRIYRIRDDGMALESFFNRAGQKVANGSFMPIDRYRSLSSRTPAFQRGYLEKWQHLYNHVEASSLH